MLVVVVGQFFRRMLVVVGLPRMFGIVMAVVVDALDLVPMRMAVLVQMLVAVGVGVGVAVGDVAVLMFVGMHVAVFVLMGMFVAVAMRAVMGTVHGCLLSWGHLNRTEDHSPG